MLNGLIPIRLYLYKHNLSESVLIANLAVGEVHEPPLRKATISAAHDYFAKIFSFLHHLNNTYQTLIKLIQTKRC
jgi:hypothetical protein